MEQTQTKKWLIICTQRPKLALKCSLFSPWPSNHRRIGAQLTESLRDEQQIHTYELKESANASSAICRHDPTLTKKHELSPRSSGSASTWALEKRCSREGVISQPFEQQIRTSDHQKCIVPHPLISSLIFDTAF